MQHIPPASGRPSVVTNPPTSEPSEGFCSKICSFVKSFFTYLLLFISLGCCDLREKEITKKEDQPDDDRSRSPSPVPSTHSSANPSPIPSPLPQNPPVPLGVGHVVTHTPPTVLPPVVAHDNPTPPSLPLPSAHVSPPPVSLSPPPVVFPQGLPTPEQNVKMYEWLKVNAHCMEKKIEFEVDGVPMCAWKSFHSDAINVQEMAAFADDLLDHNVATGGLSASVATVKKLGLQFDTHGKIISVYVDGQSEGTNFPEDRVKWIKGLKDTVLSPQNATNLELNMLKEMSEIHKGLSRKTLLTLSDGSEVFAWYNPQYKVILMQPKHLFQVSLQDKLGFSIDSEGDIQSVHVAGALVANIPDDMAEWVELLKDKCFVERRNRLLAESKPAEKFDRKDLIMLKTFLAQHSRRSRPLLFEYKGDTYGAWSYEDAYYIQKHDYIQKGSKHMLSMNIRDDGILERFAFQGTLFTNFSKSHLGILNACMMNFVFSETEYTSDDPDPSFMNPTPMIQATILKQAIPRGVTLHLDQYAYHLNKVMATSPGVLSDPKLSISYIDERLQQTGGVDAGGLSRGFFPDVVAAICDRQHPNMQVVKRAGVFRPMTQMTPTEDEPEKKMELSTDEQAAWEKLGMMMMHCFHSKSNAHYTTVYVLGSYFEKTLYELVLSLTAEEIEGGMKGLTPNRLIQLMEILIKADPEAEQMKNSLQILKKDVHTLSNDDIAKSFYNSGCDCEDWGLECFSMEPTAVQGVDIEKVKARWADICKGLLSALLASPYAREIAPMMAIAKGMKSIVGQNSNLNLSGQESRWLSLCGTNTGDMFADKIQGTIDRAIICQRFQLEGYFNDDERENVTQKVNWMKRWIESDATEDQVKGFLRFVTGGVSLPDKKISVSQSYSDSPLPGAHTCSLVIDIKPTPTVVEGYNDTTYQGFINCLKSSMETDGIIG